MTRILVLGLTILAAGVMMMTAGQPAGAVPAGWSGPINVSQSPGNQSGAPRLVLTGDGTVHTVWHEDLSSISYAFKAVASSSFSAAQDISCATAGPSWTPDIDADGGNNLHAVWTDQTTGNGDPYYQYKPSAGGWSCPPTNVRPSGAFSPAQRIAADSSGNVDIAWSEAMGAAGDIFDCRKPSGGAWICQNLDENSPSFPHQSSPSMATDASGNVHMVFNETGDGSFNAYRIMYRSRPSGGSWSGKVEVDFSPSASLQPDLAVQADGTVHVVWADSREGTPKIYYRKYQGGSWSAVTRIADTATGALTPTIAVDGTGAVHVAWREGPTDGSMGPSGNGDIYYSKNSGSGWSAPIDASGSPANAAAPAIAVDGSGRARVVWQDTRDGNSEIYYAGEGGAPLNTPPLGVSANGPYYANVGSFIQFFATAFDADGDTLSYNWNFGDGTSSAGSSPLKSYAGTGTYVVTVSVSDGHTPAVIATTSAVISTGNNADQWPGYALRFGCHAVNFIVNNGADITEVVLFLRGVPIEAGPSLTGVVEFTFLPCPGGEPPGLSYGVLSQALMCMIDAPRSFIERLWSPRGSNLAVKCPLSGRPSLVPF